MKPLAAVFALLVSCALAVVGRSAVPRVVSPEVHADHSVSFRLYAPNAQAVLLSLESYPTTALQKDAAGIWTVTLPPLESDFYGYGFVIDGLGFSDPSNPNTRPNLIWPSSFLRVPGPATLSWEVNDVPRGEIHHHIYRSAVGGVDRDYWVYTPPGYRRADASRYPTLYLLHGFSDDARAWTAVGRINIIADNLIAWHQARPMVIVMPWGYGSDKIIGIGRQGGGDMHAGGDHPVAENTRLFQRTLLEEMMPQVEREYGVSPDRGDRAIAGFSMGGGQALQIGLNHADRFGWVGAFSAGGLTTDIPGMFPEARAQAAQYPLDLLWIACGRDDSLYPASEQLRQYFTSQGIHHVDVTTPGAHAWQVWRRNVTEFLPLLFQ
jgi:enterochelin esterase family protein